MKAKPLLLILVFILSLVSVFADELNLVYDADGNLVTGDGLYRQYNGLNQLVKVYNGSDSSDPILQEFVYDPVEERVAIKITYNSDNSVKETVYYFSDEYVRVVNASGSFDTEYVYMNNQMVAQINPDGSKYFIAADHLGSSSVILNESGNVIENSSYDPFGNILSGGEETRYDYTGQEYDSIMGDYDYNARRYNPEQGQFSSPDKIISNAYNPQMLNAYAYALNNPFIYIDPDGKTVYLHARDVKVGNTKVGNHIFIEAVPDNPEDFDEEHRDFTLSGMHNENNELVIIKDWAGDKNVQISATQVIETPEGMTDTEFINMLIALYEDYEKYDIKEEYDFMSWSEYNSNDAASSLLSGAGYNGDLFGNNQLSGPTPGLGGYSERIATLRSELISSIAASGGGIAKQ